MDKKIKQIKEIGKIYQELSDENKELLFQQALLILTVQRNMTKEEK